MKRVLIALLLIFALSLAIGSFWLFGTLGGDDPAGGETPGGDTPGGDTPGGDTPGGDTPGGDTPGDETPGEDNSGDEEGDGYLNTPLFRF